MEIGSLVIGTALGSTTLSVVTSAYAYALHLRDPCVMAQCGHATKRRGKLRAYGEALVVQLAQTVRPALCLKCLEKRAIRCFICGKPIFPIGEPVTLYPIHPDDETDECGFHMELGRLKAVGCLCAGRASGDSWDGVWTPEGFVKRPMGLDIE